MVCHLEVTIRMVHFTKQVPVKITKTKVSKQRLVLTHEACLLLYLKGDPTTNYYTVSRYEPINPLLNQKHLTGPPARVHGDTCMPELAFSCSASSFPLHKFAPKDSLVI